MESDLPSGNHNAIHRTCASPALQERLAFHVVVSLETFGSQCHPACPSPGLQECLAIHIACILEARRNQCNPSHMCVTCASGMICIPPCGAVIRDEKPPCIPCIKCFTLASGMHCFPTCGCCRSQLLRNANSEHTLMDSTMGFVCGGLCK